MVNYTPLVAQAVPEASGDYTAADEFDILLSNVKMNNQMHLLALIEEKRTDLVLVMEVNEWWDAELKSIETSYPHMSKRINSVTSNDFIQQISL